MTPTAIWGVHPTVVTVLGALLGVCVGALLNSVIATRADRRKRLAEARQAAYLKAASSLGLIRQYLRVEHLYAAGIAEIRNHLHRVDDTAPDLAGLAADRISELKERRDRMLEHVLRPLLEIRTEVTIFGSAAVNAALDEVSGQVEHAIAADGELFDAATFETALSRLHARIRAELAIAS